MEEMKHPLEQFLFCPRCGSNDFVVHDVKSKHCNSCGFTYYLNPSAATVAVIVNERNEILVCRRAKEPARGTLDLPGGFCDRFETSEEGVMREVTEETGLEVVETSYLFSFPNEYLYSGFVVPTLDLFFLCRVKSTERIVAMDDVDACFWIPVEDLCEDDFGLHSIKKAVKSIKEMFLYK